MKRIAIKGARVHNLKGFDISIPKNKLVVATGVSGSGKSSLAFDIIFEEGRRQYLQSLGILTDVGGEDKFESISGIGPAIAVKQSIVRQSNPRSTVGSKTNILNLLGILYSGEGSMICPTCGAILDESLTCGECGDTCERLPASYFSYNAPNGMCIRCSGRGSYFEIDLEKLVPDNETTLREVFDKAGVTPGYRKLLSKKYSDYFYTPFCGLPDEVKDEVIYGYYSNSNSERLSYCLTRIFQSRLYRNDEDIGNIYRRTVCPDCGGYRIGEEARGVLLGGRHVGELGRMTISELHDFLLTLQLRATFQTFGNNLLNEIIHKTGSLIKARLGHLSLYREMPSLSGGEIQRLFLNSHLDSRMDSLIYILDEPTAGLHESEKAGLLKSILELKESGNTVIVVEHDRNTIEIAEHIIDIGPKAGAEGGQVVYQGDLNGLLNCDDSITGRYLSGRIPMPARKSKKEIALDKQTPCLTIRHAKTNNLKDVTVSFPLGVLTGVAGVSGSGKSSLVSDTLIPLLKDYFRGRNGNGGTDGEETEISGDGEMGTAGTFDGDSGDTAEAVGRGGAETFGSDAAEAVVTAADRLEGMEHISGYAEISQASIGRNENSNPATYIGIWDKIRRLFAEQPEAVVKGLSSGYFSFNSKGGCTACGGSGLETIRLGGDFSMQVTCRECRGKRYNDDALAVRYKGKSIFDILEMTVSEAVGFFGDDRGIIPVLKVMERIGMGYIKLGQPTPTLSGGEAQRIKLAREIGRRRKGHILYVLDEPTTGLSLFDTAKLLSLLDELVALGNSVIVIEHDPVILRACDWIIELGPGGGCEGGNLIAEGPPQVLKEKPESVTGRYL